jgi:hypothetical protein
LQRIADALMGAAALLGLVLLMVGVVGLLIESVYVAPPSERLAVLGPLKTGFLIIPPVGGITAIGAGFGLLVLTASYAQGMCVNRRA